MKANAPFDTPPTMAVTMPKSGKTTAIAQESSTIDTRSALPEAKKYSIKIDEHRSIKVLVWL